MQHGAGVVDIRMPLIAVKQVAEVIHPGDSARARFGTNCGADRRRASDHRTDDTGSP